MGGANGFTREVVGTTAVGTVVGTKAVGTVVGTTVVGTTAVGTTTGARAVGFQLRGGFTYRGRLSASGVRKPDWLSVGVPGVPPRAGAGVLMVVGAGAGVATGGGGAGGVLVVGTPGVRGKRS